MSFAHAGARGLLCICVARGSRKCAFSSMRCRIFRAPASPYLRRCMPLLCSGGDSRQLRHEIAALYWFATRPSVHRRTFHASVCRRPCTGALFALLYHRIRGGARPCHAAVKIPAGHGTDLRPCTLLPMRPRAVRPRISGPMCPCYAVAEIPATCVMNLRPCIGSLFLARAPACFPRLCIPGFAVVHALTMHRRRFPPVAS